MGPGLLHCYAKSGDSVAVSLPLKC